MAERIRRIVVVGGGLAGLASAVEMATHFGGDAQITLVERNTHVGGKMNVLRDKGYSFDMGPTIITIPDVLRGIITRSGRTVTDYIDLRRLDPQWRCMYNDGTVIDLQANVEAMALAMDKQFAGKLGGHGVGAGWTRFIKHARRMYGLSEKVFFYKDLGGVGDMMRLSPLGDPKLLKDVLAMRMHSTVGATLHGMIPEPHLRQLAEHFLQYVGSSPFLAPAILTLIAAAQVDHGVWYPMGGTRMVAKTLERIATEQGVTLLTGVGVRRVLTTGDSVSGVELDDGRTLAADIVVSNCDVQRTMRDLLDTAPAKARAAKLAKQYTPACSGVVLYLGLDKQYDHLAHHDFLFSGNSEHEFDDIYTKGIPARDPTLYLAAPSRTDPNQAPPGCESLYVLVHTPYLRPGQRWEGPGGLMEQYRPVIMNKLKTCGRMSDIEQHIVCEHCLHPGLIEAMYNAQGGAIYGLASHGRLAGGFKPRNRTGVHKSLYVAGGSANPGPGVPMVLMSGVTAARCVIEDCGGKPEPIIHTNEGGPVVNPSVNVVTRGRAHAPV